MDMFFHYWKMELRRALAVFAKSLRYFVVAVLGFCAAAYLCSSIFGESAKLEKAEVAVVVPEEKKEDLEFLIQLVSAMQSAKSICRLCTMEQTEAMEKLAGGELSAVLVFPEHFYREVDELSSTSVRLYLSEQASVSTQTFQELLEDGISMIRTTEAGVLSILSQADGEKTRVVHSEVGNTVAIHYMEAAFDRGILYQDMICSPYGNYGQRGYGQNGSYGSGGYSGNSTYGNGSYGNPFGGDGPFGGFYDRYTYNNAGSSAQDDNPKVRAAGNFISNGYYNEALKVLGEVPFSERRGQWYYYSAIANQRIGNTATAIEHIQRAVSLEPGNMQYRQFQQTLEHGGTWYANMGDMYGRPDGTSNPCCSILATLLCCQLMPFCC